MRPYLLSLAPSPPHPTGHRPQKQGGAPGTRRFHSPGAGWYMRVSPTPRGMNCEVQRGAQRGGVRGRAAPGRTGAPQQVCSRQTRAQGGGSSARRQRRGRPGGLHCSTHPLIFRVVDVGGRACSHRQAGRQAAERAGEGPGQGCSLPQRLVPPARRPRPVSSLLACTPHRWAPPARRRSTPECRGRTCGRDAQKGRGHVLDKHGPSPVHGTQGCARGCPGGLGGPAHTLSRALPQQLTCR